MRREYRCSELFPSKIVFERVLKLKNLTLFMLYSRMWPIDPFIKEMGVILARRKRNGMNIEYNQIQ